MATTPKDQAYFDEVDELEAQAGSALAMTSKLKEKLNAKAVQAADNADPGEEDEEDPDEDDDDDMETEDE